MLLVGKLAYSDSSRIHRVAGIIKTQSNGDVLRSHNEMKSKKI